MCFLCSQCQQQGLNHTCRFFAGHHLMLAIAQDNLTDPQVQLQIYMYLLVLSCCDLLGMPWSSLVVIYTAAVNFWSCCCGLEQDEAAAMICCYDLLWSFCRLWLAYIYLLVIFGTVAVIYILSSLIVQLHFMDDGHMCNFILWLPFFVLGFWSAVHSNQLWGQH